jgi:hypothetical protein
VSPDDFSMISRGTPLSGLGCIQLVASPVVDRVHRASGGTQ